MSIVNHTQIEPLYLTGMVDEEYMPESGVLTSPKYPQRYPISHDSTQTVQVAEGKTISFTFTDFNTERGYDYVEIIDEDGTNLTPGPDAPKLWGSQPRLQGLSNSNIMHVKFHTDGSGQRTGWRMEWNEQ